MSTATRLFRKERIMMFAVLGVSALVFLCVLFLCARHVVPPGYWGIAIRWGEVIPFPFGPGAYAKWPLFTKVIHIASSNRIVQGRASALSLDFQKVYIELAPASTATTKEESLPSSSVTEEQDRTRPRENLPSRNTFKTSNRAFCLVRS